jgi:hypothetical protein
VLVPVESLISKEVAKRATVVVDVLQAHGKYEVPLHVIGCEIAPVRLPPQQVVHNPAGF